MDFDATWQRDCDAIHDVDDDAMMSGRPHTAVVRGCLRVCAFEDEHTKIIPSPSQRKIGRV